MSSLLAPPAIGDMITITTRRSLDEECGLRTSDPRLATDAGDDDASRRQRIEQRT